MLMHLRKESSSCFPVSQAHRADIGRKGKSISLDPVSQAHYTDIWPAVIDRET